MSTVVIGMSVDGEYKRNSAGQGAVIEHALPLQHGAVRAVCDVLAKSSDLPARFNIADYGRYGV